MEIRYTYDFVNEFGEWKMEMQAFFCDRNSAEKFAITMSEMFKEEVRFKADNQSEYQYVKYQSQENQKDTLPNINSSVTIGQIWDKAKELNAVDFAGWYIKNAKNIRQYDKCVFYNDKGLCWSVQGECNPLHPLCDYRLS